MSVLEPSPYFFEMIILHIYILPRMHVMHDFIRMSSVELWVARLNRTKIIQNEKNVCLQLDSNTQTWDSKSADPLPTWLAGMDKHSPLKVTFIHTSNSSTFDISSQHDKIEHILFCACTDCCFVLEYIYIKQIAKRRKSDCFQHAKHIDSLFAQSNYYI